MAKSDQPADPPEPQDNEPAPQGRVASAARE
jgi:hypothetical protein